MSDSLAAKLQASTLNDAADKSDWKKNLNIPTRDNRHQTEVRLERFPTGFSQIQCVNLE